MNMAIHDWTRIDDGGFHDFHCGWIVHLRESLNNGILPTGYTARAEQIAGPFGPDLLTLHDRVSEPLEMEQNGDGHHANGDGGHESHGGVTTATLPSVRHKVTARTSYVRLRKTVTIRHATGRRVVAMIEILSPGNKKGARPLQQFVDKVVAAIGQGIHVLVIDLFPPTTRDPHGVHPVIWKELTENDDEAAGDPDKPLTLASYEADRLPTAYLEYVAVGDEMSAMPLFLAPERYIEVPLAATYAAAFAGLASDDRQIVENVPT